jgi:mannitol/fructose-specific phosphotransferase system IIA component (Ntr-type)
MHSRGAIENILANVALQSHLILRKMFVSLVFLAIATSMLPGPLLHLLIASSHPTSFTAYISTRAFASKLWEGAIDAVCGRIGMAGSSSSKLYEVEPARSPGRDNRCAMPHTAVTDLSAPRVVVGLAPDGTDFQSPSGVTAQVVILVLTPGSDMDAQHDLLQDIASFTSSQEFVDELLTARSITELFALVQIERGERPHAPRTV